MDPDLVGARASLVTRWHCGFDGGHHMTSLCAQAGTIAIVRWPARTSSMSTASVTPIRTHHLFRQVPARLHGRRFTEAIVAAMIVAPGLAQKDVQSS